MKRSLLTAGVAGALFMLAACETPPGAETQPTSREMAETSMGMLNTTCPLSGDPVDPNAKTVSYAGHKLGFCCDMCVTGWNKQSASDKAAYVASQTR